MFFTILFADDTTLSQNGDNYDNLMKKFYDSIGYLTEWCSFNKVDINWKIILLFLNLSILVVIMLKLSLNLNYWE